MKLIIIALFAVAAAIVSLPLVTSLTDGNGNVGEKLASAAELTQERASEMKDAYAPLIPQVSFNSVATATGTPGNGTTTNRGIALQAGENGDSQTPVQKAMALMTKIEAQNATSSDETQLVEILEQEWRPQYKRAIQQFDEFKRNVSDTEELIASYKETQTELTEQISDPDLRKRLRGYDQEGFDAIDSWLVKAKEILNDANEIKTKLDDMDIIITKLGIESRMRDLQNNLLAIPPGMKALFDRIDEFNDQTFDLYDKINATEK